MQVRSLSGVLELCLTNSIWLEYLPLKQGVQGSSPWWGTKCPSGAIGSAADS